MMDMDQYFGRHLRALREDKGLSQQELAYRTELDRTYISMLERGLRQPSLETVLRLAEALDMRASGLVDPIESQVRGRHTPGA